MLDAVQGRDTSVRGTISKGRFVQGAQHPRIFGQGHTGRGHINPATPAPLPLLVYYMVYGSECTDGSWRMGVEDGGGGVTEYV
jgi:hypothetical protein